MALLSWAVAGERLLPLEIAGTTLATFGIASLAFDGRRGGLGHFLYPALAGLFTAAYILVDGLGARAHGDALAYFVWMNVVTAPWLLVYGLARKGRSFLTAIKEIAGEGALAALIAMTSYAIAVWALALDKMGRVATLRETSVVFAAIMGAVFLKEPFGTRRLVAAILVAAGLMIARG